MAKKKHWARLIDAQTGLEVGKAFSFQNNTNDFSRLLGRISKTKEKSGAK